VSSFELPPYHPPDFSTRPFLSAPPVTFRTVDREGVAPDSYHGTSIFPEYFQLQKGKWTLLKETRMDCAVVLEGGRELKVREFRHLKPGDSVACGRGENGEDGIFVHTQGFTGLERDSDKFRFRSRPSRETSFSIDYDQLYALLEYERSNGFILWVLGPAVVFDRDARESFTGLVDHGYVHGLLAGNALATHDIEGSLFGTALGQDIYSKSCMLHGHYNHLDTLNRIRAAGSIRRGIEAGLIRDGIMRELVLKDIPFVLAGSIRDDGPLPEVIGDAYLAQDRMRALTRRATTVIALATQLHSIATGNMVPSYTVTDRGRVRPVFFYIVDMSEFVVGKLANRGSLTGRSILTNVQDFIVTVSRGLLK
jgi:lysine-ketoglutarate reductase/saccharopine dehydrogenase-like protein (TIGR00300 family)